MVVTIRTKHGHKGKNNPLLFVYSPFTEQVQYLGDTGVHMCERKAEQKLAVHKQEMWCAGFAVTNRDAASGRETV